MLGAAKAKILLGAALEKNILGSALDKSYACTCDRWKAMLGYALHKKLCLERR